jgi:propanol-preferring alcohol dehydrogenase
MSYIRPKGVVVAVGLPSDGAQVKADVFWTVLQAKTLVGSYVGSRLDAIEALRIAAEGHVKCQIKVQPFETISDVLKDMEEGKLQGRVVLDRKWTVRVS